MTWMIYCIPTKYDCCKGYLFKQYIHTRIIPFYLSPSCAVLSLPDSFYVSLSIAVVYTMVREREEVKVLHLVKSGIYLRCLRVSHSVYSIYFSFILAKNLRNIVSPFGQRTIEGSHGTGCFYLWTIPYGVFLKFRSWIIFYGTRRELSCISPAFTRLGMLSCNRTNRVNGSFVGVTPFYGGKSYFPSVGKSYFPFGREIILSLRSGNRISLRNAFLGTSTIYFFTLLRVRFVFRVLRAEKRPPDVPVYILS